LSSFDDNVKKILEKSELTEEDEQILEKLGGEPTEVDVRTGEDLDPHYRGNCYVRFIIKPYRVWAARNKDESGKRKMGIQFQALQMEIIQLPYNGDNSVKNVYTKYSFGKNKNSSTEVDKLLIKPDPIMDTNTIVSKKEEPKKVELVKEEKKQTKTVVVEESEEESEEDSEDSDASEEVEVKPVSKGKQVVSKIPLKKK
jgi:hypothetical protein